MTRHSDNIRNQFYDANVKEEYSIYRIENYFQLLLFLANNISQSATRGLKHKFKLNQHLSSLNSPVWEARVAEIL